MPASGVWELGKPTLPLRAHIMYVHVMRAHTCTYVWCVLCGLHGMCASACLYMHVGVGDEDTGTTRSR